MLILRKLKILLSRFAIKAFDKWSSTYHYDAPLKLQRRGYTYEELACMVASWLRLKDGSILLDIGIGTGELTKYLYFKGKVWIIGIDISKNMLYTASKHINHISLIRCSAEALPIANSRIDGVCCTFVLHSILDQGAALSEINRVLKSGARGVMVDLCIDGTSWLRKLCAFIHSIVYEHGAPALYRSPNEYKKMAELHGLKVIEIKQLGIKKTYTHFLFKFIKFMDKPFSKSSK
jgi:ubiquinone/menaquinone biosynthesis C-methylase UbiE